MPGQRAKGQKLVAFPLDEGLLAVLDRARGNQSRSAVVRAAIYKHLVDQGYELPEKLMDAPDRVGKGGRPTHKGLSKKKSARNEAKKKKP